MKRHLWRWWLLSRSCHRDARAAVSQLEVKSHLSGIVYTLHPQRKIRDGGSEKRVAAGDNPIRHRVRSGEKTKSARTEIREKHDSAMFIDSEFLPRSVKK